MTEVAILGVGLIGGSLALSLKKNENIHITGFDVMEDNLRMALSLGVIDRGTTQLRMPLPGRILFFYVPRLASCMN